MRSTQPSMTTAQQTAIDRAANAVWKTKVKIYYSDGMDHTRHEGGYPSGYGFSCVDCKCLLDTDVDSDVFNVLEMAACNAYAKHKSFCRGKQEILTRLQVEGMLELKPDSGFMEARCLFCKSLIIRLTNQKQMQDPITSAHKACELHVPKCKKVKVV